MNQEVRTELAVYGGKTSYILVVEPWADEFEIRPGDRCKVVVKGPGVAEFGIEFHSPEHVVVSILTGGTTFEFWRGDSKEY